MRFCFQLGAVALLLAGPAALSAEPKRGSKRTIEVPRVDPRSGAEVHTLIVPRQAAPPKPVVETAPPKPTVPNVQAIVEEAALKFNVHPALIDSVIQVESGYNAHAISPKGAQGLMQLMPETARRFGVVNPFDPRENILGGAQYLKFLQDTFKDDRLAIAAYNAGEGAVAKYNNVPPFPETVNYVAAVGKRYSKAKQSAAAKKPEVPAAKPDAQPEGPPQPVYSPVRQFFDAEGRLHLTTTDQ